MEHAIRLDVLDWGDDFFKDVQITPYCVCGCGWIGDNHTTDEDGTIALAKVLADVAEIDADLADPRRAILRMGAG